MNDIAIGQIVWFLTGIATGAVLFCCLAMHRGWFARRTDVTVDWSNIDIPVTKVVNDVLMQAQKQREARPQTVTHVLVDWKFINSVIQSEGYMLVAKPKDSDAITRPQ